MRTLDLAGSWTCTDLTSRKQVPATVPGCVHLDLIAAGKLPDLFWRDNEDQYHWVAQRDWQYARDVTVDASLLASERIWLRCDGLDTLAEVTINGIAVLGADNMFRTWEVDAKAALKLGRNRIVVTFRSPLPVMAAGQKKRHLHAWNLFRPEYAGNGWVRKMACSFGWDWGPMAAGCGIWRGIALIAADGARLGPVRLRQRHHDGGVDLAVEATVERSSGAGWRLRATAEIDDRVVARLEADAATPLTLAIADPQLWWPNGMGAQALYRITVELIRADGAIVDRWSRSTGLRTIAVVREKDAWGESFAFACNGVQMFAKGTNWIPADIFVPRLRRADYERLLGAAADANMNMIRAWGGGIYEQDDFYEVCDQRGLLVWQDFMFACSTYPTHEPAFMASVRAEAVDNLRRLRHHPSIALWCGNNELEQGLVGPAWTATQMSWDDYGKLFDHLLPELVAAEDGERAYWPCSPHTPHGERTNFNDPTCGDAHCWDVWGRWLPFEGQRAWNHRFQSEFGFQSFPEPRTLAAFAAPEDMNLTSYIMDFHQRSAGRGNKCILAYIADYFRVPKDLEQTIWTTQLSQALCIQIAVEHARRSQPRCMGTLYWQINDLWPAATWSSIDVFGRWKALHHFARRFYAPVLVSGLEDPKASTVEVHVSSHLPRAAKLRASWRITDVDGTRLATGKADVEAASQSAQRVAVVDLAKLVAKHTQRRLLVWLAVSEGAEVLSTNLVTLARPKHLELPRGTVKATVKAAGAGAFAVTLTSKIPALWTRQELAGQDAAWSDNWLHLDGAAARTVTVHPAKALTLAQVRKALRVTDLANTYLP